MIIRKVLDFYTDQSFIYAVERGTMYVIAKTNGDYVKHEVGVKMRNCDYVFLASSLRSARDKCDKRGIFSISTASNIMTFIREVA